MLKTLLSVASVAAVGMLVMVDNASAGEYYIDNFTVTRNGAAFFDDSFSDGIPPPSAPAFVDGTYASYTVKGTLGPETNGKLLLSATRADIPDGKGNSLVQSATLRTGVAAGASTVLSVDDIFVATALYDFVLPANVGEGYGIQFTDTMSDGQATGPSYGDDVVGLMVKRNQAGNLVVEFVRNDMNAGATTLLASVALEGGHDQIRLSLAKATAGLATVTASFAYVDGGVVGGSVTMPETTDIFHGETYTRAKFLAVAPYAYGVAEGVPASLNLMAHVRVAEQLRNRVGNLYLGATLANQWSFHNGNGWQAWSGGPIPCYCCSCTLNDQVVPVAQSMDVTAYPGVGVYLGYGLSEAAMLESGSYSWIYTVPSN